MKINRIMHLYWNSKRKRVHKKNLSRYCRYIYKQGRNGCVG